MEYLTGFIVSFWTALCIACMNPKKIIDCLTCFHM